MKDIEGLEKLRLDVANNQCTVQTATTLYMLIEAYNKALQGDVEPVIVVRHASSDYYTCMQKDLQDLPEGTKLYTSSPNTQARLDKAIEALEEVREVYAGMDGFKAETAPEAYLQRIIKSMYEIVRESLKTIGS